MTPKKAMLAALGAATVALGVSVPAILTPAEARERAAASAQAAPARGAPRVGQAQRGRASYYDARRFAGRKMANGQRFNPNSNVAAHRTLPLGSRVQVTNLENGRSAEVRVEDRGPYAGGRVIDLTPRTAEQLDMKQQGTAPVEVRPLEIPQRDGRVAAR